MAQYWLQTQAPAGNWTDYLGSDDKQRCIDHGQYLVDERDYSAAQVRVVERVDTAIWTPDLSRAAVDTSIKRCIDERGASKRSPIWEGYVNRTLVVFDRRRWLVEAVLRAIVAGHIPSTGDTIAALSRWAEQHDQFTYNRIAATRADGLK